MEPLRATTLRISGDVLFAAMFMLLGLVWVWGAFDFPFWSGFAPDSGFLPLVFGGLLVVLSAAVAVTAMRAPTDATAREPLTKSLQILSALVVSVGAIGFLGFLAPLFGLMLFLYAYVEKLPLVRSVLAAGGTTALLAVVFERLLKIPLPLTPWGF